MALSTAKFRVGDKVPRLEVCAVNAAGTAVAPAAVIVDSTTTKAAGVDAFGNLSVRLGAGNYETVAASQTAQVLGATGATGDFLERLLVIPATTSPGSIAILDGSTSITVFAGGASSVASLTPFSIMVGAYSTTGPWKVTTGANVSVIGFGSFTA